MYIVYISHVCYMPNLLLTLLFANAHITVYAEKYNSSRVVLHFPVTSPVLHLKRPQPRLFPLFMLRDRAEVCSVYLGQEQRQ
jgi:hypothetical protein